MAITYNIHRYYSSRPGAGDEFGAALDREFEGAWKKCAAQNCPNYHHPDSDYCAKHALGDANEYLGTLSKQGCDDEETADSVRWVKYWEAVLLYEAAAKGQEEEAWSFMELRREQVMNPSRFTTEIAA